MYYVHCTYRSILNSRSENSIYPAFWTILYLILQVQYSICLYFAVCPVDPVQFTYCLSLSTLVSCSSERPCTLCPQVDPVHHVPGGWCKIRGIPSQPRGQHRAQGSNNTFSVSSFMQFCGTVTIFYGSGVPVVVRLLTSYGAVSGSISGP